MLLLLAPLLACTSPSVETDPLPTESSSDEESEPGEDTGSTGASEDTEDSGVAWVDADGDGSPEHEDCDDADEQVFPGADERCNGTDDDCDEVSDEGLAAPWCMTPSDSCPLVDTARTLPEPVVALSFDDEGDPWQNDGSAGALTWWGDVSSTDRGASGLGRRFTRVGTAVDGNGYVVFQTQEDFEVETFTVSAWIHPDEYDERGTILNMLWDSAPSGLSLDYYAGLVRLALGDGSDIEDFWVPAPAETWTHVAATFDGEQVAIYIDGELRLREHPSSSFSGVAHYPAHLLIGSYQNPAYYAFDGVIDEVMLWDEALSGAEVRDSLTVARYRFEQGDGGDSGPASRDAELTAATECGPVGEAWLPDGTSLETELPALTDGFGLRAWVRPATGGSIAAVDGAWSLSATGDALTLDITCDDGTTASLTAPDALSEGSWAEVAAAFDDGHLRLHVDGSEVADERSGCFTLADVDADLVVGEDFDGGLDEVELRSVPRGSTAVQRRVTWASWRSMDATADSSGLADDGPLALELSGTTTRSQTDDQRYPCLHVQAAWQESCGRTSGALTASASLSGPLTLHGWARPVTTADDTALLAVEDGPSLGVEGGVAVLRWGEVEVVGSSTLSEDAWTPLAAAVHHDRLQLFEHGVLVGEATLSTGATATERFAVGSALSWQSGDVWAEELGIDGFAWTEDDALARHAPWRTEDHPRLTSAETMVSIWDDSWAEWCDYGGEFDADDETLSHYERSLYAWYCAEAAYQAGARDEHYDTALALLTHIDHGEWDWSWEQGRSLFWYALAYDRLAPLMLELEETDPHGQHAQHALLRRRFASAVHQIATVGDIHHDDLLYDYGYYHPDPVYLAANSRLMSVSGNGHISLAMPAMADGDFGTAEERLDLVIDDLFYERPAAYEASGERLAAFLHASGLFTEGHGYQSDVFAGMTPFLIDWWSLGGEDRVTEGRVRAMYDANVATMLPTGHVWPYATGWLGWQSQSDLMAEFVDSDAAESYRWFDARQHGESTTYSEPGWTSAAVGDEAMVLRSGWQDDDLWLGLKGRTEPCPSSHCQEDQLSLMMVAHGAWLLIDPGDGRSYRSTSESSQEAWLQSASGHNNVLVDGIGPGLDKEFGELVDPAELTVSLLAERADYGRMEGTIADGLASGGADHTRHVWLVDDAFFVLVDQLDADGDATFSQQFHLGGPLDSGAGDYTGARPDFAWSTTSDDGIDVDLDVVQLAPVGELRLQRSTDGGTNFNYPLTWDHTYVRAQLDGEQATFVTLLLAGTASDPAPVVTVLQEEEDLRFAEVELADGSELELGYNATGGREAPGLADTDALIWGTDGASWAFLADGSQLDAGAELGAWADCTLHALQLELDGDELVAAVSRESGGCTLDVAWPDAAPASVEIDGASSSAWSWADDVLTLSTAPEQSLVVSASR